MGRTHAEARALKEKAQACAAAGMDTKTLATAFGVSLQCMQKWLVGVDRPRAAPKHKGKLADPSRYNRLLLLASCKVTVQEAGDDLGVTRERARQLFVKVGLNDLRMRPTQQLTNYHSMKSEGLRVCSICKQQKPLSDISTDGSRCNACKAAQTAERYHDPGTGYKERMAERQRSPRGKALAAANSARWYYKKKLQQQQAEAASVQAADAVSTDIALQQLQRNDIDRGIS